MTVKVEVPVNREHWHLNKSVPITLIVAMMANFFYAVWFTATLDSKVDHFAEKIAELELKSSKTELRATDVSDRVIRIEEKLANQSLILHDIKAGVIALSNGGILAPR